MKKRANEGGDKGADIGETGPSVPPTMTEQDTRALWIVREADDDRVDGLQHQQNMEILEDVRSGWVPQTEREWRKVRLVARRLEHPPIIYDDYEPGGVAEREPHAADVELREVCFRIAQSTVQTCRANLDRALESAPPPTPVIDVTGDDDYLLDLNPSPFGDLSRFHPGGVRAPVTEPAWSTRESPERIARLQVDLQTAERKFTEMLTEHPWTAFRLKLGPGPTSATYRSAVPRKPVKAPRDLFTYTSVKKARERAADSDGRIKILPRWSRYQSVMYDEVVVAIGICPPDVDVNGERVFTLDRIKSARGYVPGNIRWADKSQQRDNQARNRRQTMTPDQIGVEPSNPAAEPTDESLMP